MKNFDWYTHVRDCLESTRFLALSTSAGSETWTCPVFFAFDKELRLYFISQPASKHMQNIAQNGGVSLAVFSTEQDPMDDVRGLQMTGKATILPDVDVDSAYKTYYARSPRDVVTERDVVENYTGAGAAWKFVRITPIEIHYFDTRYFDENRMLVPKEHYIIT